MTTFEIVRAAVLSANIYAGFMVLLVYINFTAYAFRTKKWHMGSVGFTWITLFSALTAVSVVMWS